MVVQSSVFETLKYNENKNKHGVERVVDKRDEASIHPDGL